MTHEYDLLIVGGGLVGASLACALADTPVRVGLLEAVPVAEACQPSYDDRTTALAPTTRRIFEAIGVWSELRGHYVPIREIHVSDRGRFGFARMRAEDEGLPALGYVVSNRQLGEVLPAHAAAAANVDFLCPATVLDVTTDPGAATVRWRGASGEQTAHARLLVVADGAHSATRERLGIEVDLQTYRQTAVVANLTPERPHNGRAFERFTPAGPLALLPTEGARCGLIWTVPQEQVEEVLALNDADFLARVQTLFGYRLGRLLKVGARLRYPLVNMNARRYTAERAVVIGNAAHTLHPVAGQGFNLALRDVATLAELAHAAVLCGDDPGRAALLGRYEDQRKNDYRQVAGFTHTLVQLFSNALPGLVAGRNLGLIGLDLLPPVKARFVRQATGAASPLPRLARGLPLRQGEAG
jgi:2-octaprenyl-6-methoxyphenol hydroxylase